MSSLLIDLFKYRSREKREAMEDWLTECVAAILRALPEAEFASVIKGITGQDCSEVLVAGKELHVATQVSIPLEDEGIENDEGNTQHSSQRPDLIISIGGEPWLLFECKVAHAVDESRSKDPRFASQLHRYGRWLQNSKLKQPGLERALVFLTHYTLPPADFTAARSQQPGYFGLGRHVTTWGAIARILKASITEENTGEYARTLVEAYIEFLKEKGLAEEYPNSQDVALFGVTLPALDRLDKLIDDMFARVEGVGTSWAGNSFFDAEVDIGRYHKGRWISLPTDWPTGAYIQTGLWFPDSSDQVYRTVIDEELAGMDRKVTSAPKVYLQLAHGTDNVFPRPKDVPGGDWVRPASDFFVFRDFDSFEGDPASRAVSIFSWLDEKVAELRTFVNA